MPPVLLSSQHSCRGVSCSAAANDGATILEQMEVENQVCGWVIIHKGRSETSGQNVVIRNRRGLRTRWVLDVGSQLEARAAITAAAAQQRPTEC